MQGRAFAKFCVATSGPHKVYTVLAHPTAPWREAKDDPQCAWAYALEHACGWADGTTTTNAMMSAVTSNLFYNMGFRYDTKEGAARYWIGNSFDLSGYLRRTKQTVCCYDQAYGVVTLGNLLGATAKPVFTGIFGFIESTDLIGIGTCNNPFFEGDVETQHYVVLDDGRIVVRSFTVSRDPLCAIDELGRSSFGNHMYAFVNGLIFDACAGPILGTCSHGEYLSTVIDHSTLSERENGYFFQWVPLERESAFDSVRYRFSEQQ